MTTLAHTARIEQGTIRADGYVFKQYYVGRGGRELEQWLSPEAYHRHKISQTCNSAKRRAPELGVPFDLDADYLVSIFPNDGLCPALGLPLQWGDKSGRKDSPSLDRIVPEKGYTRGNVRWLSQLANQIKTNATPEQVMAVATYLQKDNT